ncbi:MUC15 protein, partial [Campylorhamphus procurvoides]|nr:MUC15 protein [Campylorhamphus procurvoides]
VKPASQSFVPYRTTATNPSIISDAAPTAANAKENVTKTTEITSGANTTSPRFSDGTTLSSSVSKDGTNNSTTNFPRSPTSFTTFRTTGDSSGVTKSAAATPASTGTPSHSTVTFSTLGALVLPSDNSTTNLTMLYPVTVTLTSPTVKQDSPTPNFNPSQPTTKLNYNSSNTSTASPNPKDASEAKTSQGAIVGVTVGAILGSILIGLIGYFICRKKRSELFSHRRLYDDTRSDPVLHLDNSLGPYDMSFGGAPDDKTSTPNRTEEDNAGRPSNGIPMADITPSHPSP